MKRILLLTLIFGLSVQCISNDSPEDYKSIKVVELKNGSCKVYLKHVVWGLTGDNSITYISKTKHLKDTVKEPYFEALDFFYKLNDKCELLIFNSDSLHRKNLNQVSIIVSETDKIDYFNYEKEGYKNILYDR